MTSVLRLALLIFVNTADALQIELPSSSKAVNFDSELKEDEANAWLTDRRVGASWGPDDCYTGGDSCKEKQLSGNWLYKEREECINSGGMKCQAGCFSTADLTCEVCPIGRYSNAMQSKTCTFCGHGKYANQIGSTACERPATPLEFRELNICTATQTVNNVGNMGPDTGASPSMVLKEVAGSDGTVDLVITNASTYAPYDSSLNGLHHCFGSLNIKCGTSAVFTFSFQSTETAEPVTMDNFRMSFLDIDQGPQGRCKETLKFSKFIDYDLPHFTELEVREEEDGTVFAATQDGTDDDDPSIAMLDDIQEKRAVSMNFDGTQSFTVRISTEEGEPGEPGETWASRNIYFSGPTSITSMPLKLSVKGEDV